MQNISLPDKLEPQDLVKNDPILRSLLKTRANPITIGITYIVLMFLLRLVVAWTEGNLRSKGATVGYLDDLGIYPTYIIDSILWIYYIWIPIGIANVFNCLILNKVIGQLKNPADGTVIEPLFKPLLEDIRLSYSKRWLTYCAIILAIGSYFLYLQGYSNLHVWSTIATSFIITTIFTFLNFFVVFRILLCCILGIYWFRHLFQRYTIYIRPLHPDRAGGLAPLGNFTLQLSYLIAALGIFLIIVPITRNFIAFGSLGFRFTFDILSGFVLYSLASPIVFFAPLAVAHKSMKAAKDNLLLKIDENFQYVFKLIQQSLDNDIYSLEKNGNTLKELQSLHAVVNGFPIWPFNSRNLSLFATSYLSPILLALIADGLTRAVLK